MRGREGDLDPPFSAPLCSSAVVSGWSYVSCTGRALQMRNKVCVEDKSDEKEAVMRRRMEIKESPQSSLNQTTWYAQAS